MRTPPTHQQTPQPHASRTSANYCALVPEMLLLHSSPELPDSWSQLRGASKQPVLPSQQRSWLAKRISPQCIRLTHAVTKGPLYRGLLSAALKTKGLAETDGCFELSVGNPDKGQLPLDEIKRRVSQFVEQGLPLVVTQVLTTFPCYPKFRLDHLFWNCMAAWCWREHALSRKLEQRWRMFECMER